LARKKRIKPIDNFKEEKTYGPDFDAANAGPRPPSIWFTVVPAFNVEQPGTNARHYGSGGQNRLTVIVQAFRPAPANTAGAPFLRRMILAR